MTNLTARSLDRHTFIKIFLNFNFKSFLPCSTDETYGADGVLAVLMSEHNEALFQHRRHYCLVRTRQLRFINTNHFDTKLQTA